jgi:hypothetical protein
VKTLELFYSEAGHADDNFDNHNLECTELFFNHDNGDNLDTANGVTETSTPEIMVFKYSRIIF